MVKVTNIKATDVPFASQSKNFLRCLAYAKSISPDVIQLIPQRPKHQLTFELSDTNVDLANGLRRAMIDEIPIISMDVTEVDIVTDDRFILVDRLKKTIDLLPINQSIGGATVSLLVENKTDEIVPVYASQFVVKAKNGSIVQTCEFLNGSSIITYLRPLKTLTIDKITLVSGVGKIDSGKFAAFANIKYEILDMEPLVRDDGPIRGQSSLATNPKRFRFTLTDHRNLDIKKKIVEVCDILMGRISALSTALSEVKESEPSYFSDLLNVETKEDIKIFHMPGEYWTMANLLSRYCFLEDTDVAFVCPSIVHISIEESMVKIRHPQACKLLLSAMAQATSHINTVQKAFV
jgi:DNA-directed RNA polymerase subunit L